MAHSLYLSVDMLRYILSILLTALLSLLAGLYLPWWSIALAAFVVSMLIPQKPSMSFLSGFIGVFLLWEILSWWIDYKNNSILSHKVAEIFPLGGSNVLIILLTSFVGAIVAGFGALTGSYIRKGDRLM